MTGATVATPDTEPDKLPIPEQLRRDDLRFIRVPPHSKGGRDNDPGWNTTAWFPWESKALAFHLLEERGNYGVYPGPGSHLVILDVDEPDIWAGLGLLQDLEGTFMVLTGSATPEKPKAHYYIETTGLTQGKHTLWYNGIHVGEVYAQAPVKARGYVVGPGSVHPDTGWTYRVSTDAPILTKSLDRVFDIFKPDVAKPTLPARPARKQGTLTDRLNLRIEDVCRPVNSKRSGDEIIGGHPIHGSETGTNLHLNTQKNIWYCHRCGSGGDPIMWLAVEAGIIDCRDARSGALNRDAMQELIKWMRSKGYDIPVSRQFERHPRVDDDGVPDKKIIVTGNRLRDITAQALACLEYENRTPWLFVRNRALSRVGIDDEGHPHIEKLDLHSCRGILERKCDFFRLVSASKTKNPEWKEVKAIPSREVVMDLLALGNWPFPVLDGIIQTPIIHDDGSILSTEGYDPVYRLYFAPTAGTVIPPVPDIPTEDDVTKAVSLIREPFEDFPFVDEGSRAHVVAALLTTVLRPLIPGSVPLALIDKPAPGTGASLIGAIISVIATGGDGSITTAPRDEEGWRKAITSILIRGGVLVIIDNVENKLSSPSLAAVLTTPRWEDRILGKSEMISAPCRLAWIANGNNVTLGGDLPRRVIWARMDAKSQRPWQREERFKHPDILSWTKENRGDLLWAVLTLTRYWIQHDRPGPGGDDIPKLGGFEQWRDIIGGILAIGGFPGFLGNLDDLYTDMDVDGTQWEAFINRWYEWKKSGGVTVAGLIAQVNSEERDNIKDSLFERLPDDLADALRSKGSPARSIGKALSKRKDRVFTYLGDKYNPKPDGLRLENAGTRQRYAIWKVIPTFNQTHLTHDTCESTCEFTSLSESISAPNVRKDTENIHSRVESGPKQTHNNSQTHQAVEGAGGQP